MLPIVAGGIIYLITSPDAYVTRAVWTIARIENPFAGIVIEEQPFIIRFARYYLCDFLWALSLFQSIVILLGDDHILLAIGVGSIFCMVCEFSQLTAMIPGTFDVNDLLVELSAGVLALISLVNRRIMVYEKST